MIDGFEGGNVAPLKAENERLKIRVQDLLEANNRYLDRARAAEADLRQSDGLARLHDRIAEVVTEEAADGAACGWRSCTGCHETNEGYSTGFYPHSKVFGCEMGSGCCECGGLGVVWEHYSAASLAAMAADDDDTLECLGCARQVKPGDKVQDEASGEIFCEACAYTYAEIKAQHDEALASGEYGELTPEGIAGFAREYDAHIAAGGSPDDKWLYVLGQEP